MARKEKHFPGVSTRQSKHPRLFELKSLFQVKAATFGETFVLSKFSVFQLPTPTFSSPQEGGVGPQRGGEGASDAHVVAGVGGQVPGCLGRWQVVGSGPWVPGQACSLQRALPAC